MKKYRNMQRCVCIIIVVMMLPWSGTLASEWKKIGEANGIIGYTMSVGESKYEAVRAVGMVDASVAVIEAVLRDVPSSTEFVFKCKQADFVNTPEYKNTADSYYIYMVTAMPFPLKDRDGVHLHEYTIDKPTGTLYLQIKATPTDYKLSKERVRIYMMKVDYVLVPKGSNQTEVTFTSMGDPGVPIPRFIIDLFTKNLGIKTIAGLRAMVQKDKYKNSRAIITATPHLKH